LRSSTKWRRTCCTACLFAGESWSLKRIYFIQVDADTPGCVHEIDPLVDRNGTSVHVRASGEPMRVRRPPGP
jgi:hypothetical protein